MHILSVYENKAYLYDPSYFKLFSCAKEHLEGIRNTSQLKSIKVNAILQKKKKIVVNVANTCNLSCAYCNAGHGDYGRSEKRITLKGNALENVMFNIRNIKNEISSIIFFGGEPLLNPDAIEKICGEIDTEEVQFHIVTNGTVIIDKLFELFQKRKFKVTVSYDGNDEINTLLRGAESSAKAALFIKKSINVLGCENISIAVTYTPEHMLRGQSKDFVISTLSKKYPNVRIQLQDVESVPCFVGFDKEYHRIEREILRNRNYDAIHRSFKENTVDWGVFLFNVIDVFIQKKVNDYFCKDLIDGHTIAFDVDSKKYACHRFWGDKEFILPLNNNTTDYVSNLNNKNKHDICKECWAANFCNKCLVEISNIKSTGTFEIINDPCSLFKDLVGEVLLNLAILIEQENDRSFFMSNYEYNREKYLLSFYA